MSKEIFSIYWFRYPVFSLWSRPVINISLEHSAIQINLDISFLILNHIIIKYGHSRRWIVKCHVISMLKPYPCHIHHWSCFFTVKYLKKFIRIQNYFPCKIKSDRMMLLYRCTVYYTCCMRIHKCIHLTNSQIYRSNSFTIYKCTQRIVWNSPFNIRKLSAHKI